MSADEPFQTERLVIIGPGMLGTSVAIGLKRRGFAGQTVALGRSASTLEQARQTGAYDTTTDDPAQALRGATLAVIAVPLSGFRAVFEMIAAYADANLIVTDVGSTKASVIADAQAVLGDLSRVIGAHPMAGSEKAGPLAADADLFVGKPCVLTLTDQDDPEAVALVRGLWASLGMSIVTMSPEEHDRQAAAVSHLPHLASVMLVQLAETLGGLDLASTGYRDTTRLASSNPPMRADILMANRQAVLESLSVFGQRVQQMLSLLESGDREGLLDQLQQAKADRERWLASRRTIE